MANSPTPPFRILVVDDEPFSRHVVAKMFAALGAEHVVFAESGGEARKAMAKDPALSLVISDHYMPDESGIHLLGDLRQGKLPLAYDTYFVVATASSSFALTAVALALDVDSFLSKPFGKEALARRLYQFLGNDGRLIKSPEQYGELDVTAMLAVAECMDPSAPRPAGPTVPTRRLASVVPDHTQLAADLRAKDGHLLLRAGTVLTRHLIGRLTELGVTDVPVG